MLSVVMFWPLARARENCQDHLLLSFLTLHLPSRKTTDGVACPRLRRRGTYTCFPIHQYLHSSIVTSVHIVIKEQISLLLLRDGGVQSMELKGDMNLLISDAAFAHLRLTLPPPSTDFVGNTLQFKQHPNVAKFVPGQERVIALKDPSRAFPVGQSLAVLKWRYTGTDESNVPLSSKCELNMGWIDL